MTSIKKLINKIFSRPIKKYGRNYLIHFVDGSEKEICIHKQCEQTITDKYIHLIDKRHPRELIIFSDKMVFIESTDMKNRCEK